MRRRLAGELEFLKRLVEQFGAQLAWFCHAETLPREASNASSLNSPRQASCLRTLTRSAMLTLSCGPYIRNAKRVSESAWKKPGNLPSTTLSSKPSSRSTDCNLLNGRSLKIIG